VHLVAPGWNVIGAGEPALPGIALGHNEEIGWGFTIVGIDQGDLYVEKLNPANRDQYWHKGAWRNMEKERQQVPVKGRAAETVDLKYTVHGPVIHEDAANNRAFALKWVGADPGGAGYLRALAVSRAKNWSEFKSAVAGYKVPSENLVYADRAGNIGWIASGAAPIRPNWKGLLPVPGDGDYEWQGFLSLDQHPQEYNPPRHWIATANHNILPKGYPHTLGFEWNPGYRHQRIVEMMSAQSKFGVKDFERMQYDVTSVAAKQFQNVLRKRLPNAHGEMKQVYERMLRWDGRMTTDSVEASLFEVWTAFLGEAVTGSQLGAGANLTTVFDLLERESGGRALQISYDAAVAQLQRLLGTNRSQWTWGRLHTVSFQHSLRVPATLSAKFNRGPIPRPGDGNTVNAAGGGFRQSSGASYRQILDVADWDRSVITNVPGESGDPDSKHYDDLLPLWSTGRYHALPYSRKAVEAATEERIELKPKR
ncbi:MAG: penicillin acylase family protein, partial [Candidatus Solibacter usitatus]|nr:penicillin acylase family protein [Candidatus Solibacter usitatus]